MQVTLAIPDHIYRRAQRMAQLSGRAVEDILTQNLGTTLPPLAAELDSAPIASLADDALLALAASKMAAPLDMRFTYLAEKRSAGPLPEPEAAEYQMLFDLYEAGQARKAQAMVEADKRGLDWEAVVYAHEHLEG